MSEKTTITIGEIRFSYLNAFTPTVAKGATEPKYSTAILIPKTEKGIIEKIKQIQNSLKAEVAASNGGKLPTGFKIPMKDGDALNADGEREKDDNYKGMYYFNCSSKTKPTILDKNRQPILNSEEVYSGMWGYVNVNFYTFNNVSRGIGVGLNHIMKTRDDEPFASRVSADEAFKDLNFGDDDLLG